MQHGIKGRRILRRGFFGATATALGATLLLPRRGRTAESKREFCDGLDAASEPVMDEARQRIETHRKGDFKLRIVDACGQPIAGQVRLRHLRHEFRFGGPFSEHPLFVELFKPALERHPEGGRRSLWALPVGAFRQAAERRPRAGCVDA